MSFFFNDLRARLYGLRIVVLPKKRSMGLWFILNGIGNKKLYKLNIPRSGLVLDGGGYHGQFAREMYLRFGARVEVFEPVPSFAAICMENLSDTDCVVNTFALGSSNRKQQISLAENGSSFGREIEGTRHLEIEVRKASEVVSNLCTEIVDEIACLKLNIEGAEYEVLLDLIESEEIKKVKNILVQFHNFSESAVSDKEKIRNLLMETHVNEWSYEFVWELWTRSLN
jgi:FkbM family methyltransferase